MAKMACWLCLAVLLLATETTFLAGQNLRNVQANECKLSGPVGLISRVLCETPNVRLTAGPTFCLQSC